jgi:hypothetical protein
MSEQAFRAALAEYKRRRARNDSYAAVLWHKLETSYALDLARWRDQHPAEYATLTGRAAGRPAKGRLQRRLDRADRPRRRRPTLG